MGQTLTLYCGTYVGDIVVTTYLADAATKVPCNVANNNTLTFGAVSEAMGLVAVTTGASTLVWQITWNAAVGLTTT